MKPIDLTTARALIDFSGGNTELRQLGELQLEGAVALQNHIVDPDIGLGYLADEVGMGKTYIALGVVAMLRYFNPMLRVLYLCPSRNVQDKWLREYQSFTRHNLQVAHGRLRTEDGQPAVPYTSCRNLSELIYDAASGYYADFFIGKDSFSLPLNEDPEKLYEKLAELKRLIPAWRWSDLSTLAAAELKNRVKDEYARALNYILPTFDLVVIDEAHNFKHDFESSDRNQVLSQVLGFHGGGLKRVHNALLLSATPYDRDLSQLYNQLKMVGKADLLPAEKYWSEQDLVKRHLRKFLVRRLNMLNVNGEKMTRNRYRREWRKGEKAEIRLESDEQKLVMALVQKKIGDMFRKQSESPMFQTGLLASFEAFSQSARSEPVQFDGEQSEKDCSDAQDRHVIDYIIESYIENGLGRTLPHPKMDTVVKRLQRAIFEQGKKQIVFVRRVRSVNELKDKLDDAYNGWVSEYIEQSLSRYPEAGAMMRQAYQAYLAASRHRDGDTVGGEVAELYDAEESLPPKNDTFFAWFFRGETLEETKSLLNDWPTPNALRIGLTAKNQINIVLFEHNWAEFLCRKLKLDLAEILDKHANTMAHYASRFYHTTRGTQSSKEQRSSDDRLALFQACQAGFISWLAEQPAMEFVRPLASILTTPAERSRRDDEISTDQLKEQLSTVTFFSQLAPLPALESQINPWQTRLYDALHTKRDSGELGTLYLVHKALLSFLLRTGHGIIDVYLARLMQGKRDLTASSRAQWMSALVELLDEQSRSSAFSTFHELKSLAAHLELIIRNNLPEIISASKDEYRRILSRMLNPVSPIIGASGETGDRTPQARKFRMPGYPLALISTDVFQEGEDLHTFCDSVMHYGVSASPVSLEQKSGRIDRVNSLAQRRLEALGHQAEDEDYIQVSFPFVRESIESIQIRSVCRSINEYLLSLHEFGDKNISASDRHAIDTALMDKSDIPDQILDQLDSPYKVQVTQENEYRLHTLIEQNQQHHEKAVQHVQAMLSAQAVNAQADYEISTISAELDWDKINDNMAINLKTAKASGELLLSLTKLNTPSEYRPDSKTSFLEIMKLISWNTFHRTVAIKEDKSATTYRLYANAEMLVGDDSITDANEINRLFERMEIQHEPETYSNELPDEMIALLESLTPETRIPMDRHAVTQVVPMRENGTWLLKFIFGGSHQHREQRVALYQCAGRCIFLSRATNDGFASELPIEKLIEYTWIRNKNTDLVEFIVSPTGAIIGRVVHPTGGLHWKEFIYCGYTLAVETDSLEYLLNESDLH